MNRWMDMKNEEIACDDKMKKRENEKKEEKKRDWLRYICLIWSDLIWKRKIKEKKTRIQVIAFTGSGIRS